MLGEGLGSKVTATKTNISRVVYGRRVFSTLPQLGAGTLGRAPLKFRVFMGRIVNHPYYFTVNTLTAATLSNNRTPSSELVQNPSGSSAQPTSPWSKTWWKWREVPTFDRNKFGAAVRVVSSLMEGVVHFIGSGLGRKAGKEIVLRITIADDSTFQPLKSVILGSYDST